MPDATRPNRHGSTCLWIEPINMGRVVWSIISTSTTASLRLCLAFSHLTKFWSDVAVKDTQTYGNRWRALTYMTLVCRAYIHNVDVATTGGCLVDTIQQAQSSPHLQLHVWAFVQLTSCYGEHWAVRRTMSASPPKLPRTRKLNTENIEIFVKMSEFF